VIGADVLDRQLAVGQAVSAFARDADALVDPALTAALEEHVDALVDMAVARTPAARIAA
jgi:hypothetical protein